MDGILYPAIFVNITIATIIAEITMASKLIRHKSTWAPITAKYKGAKINCNL